jgi:hypothetical protein
VTDQGAARNSPLGDPRTQRTRSRYYTNAVLELAKTGTFGAAWRRRMCWRIWNSAAHAETGKRNFNGTGEPSSFQRDARTERRCRQLADDHHNGSWLEFACDDPNEALREYRGDRV